MWDENRLFFEKYQEELQRLEKQWHPLEKERARRLLYGDALGLAAQGLEKSFAGAQHVLHAHQQSTAEGYFEYLEEYLSQQAVRLAQLPNYEKSTWRIDSHFNDEPVCISTTVTCKTVSLIDKLTSVLEQGAGLFGDRIYLLVTDVAVYYLCTFEAAFALQLEQLPHLAALFYNDSRALAAFCDLRCNAEQGKLLGMETRGALVLDQALVKLQNELKEICTLDQWRYRSGVLEGPFLELLHKTLAQASLRLSLAAKVWLPILDSGLFISIMSEVIALLPTWFLDGFLGLKSIGQDARKLLVDFIHSIGKIPEEVLGPDLAARTQIYAFRKLDCIVKIIQQNLIQVSNAFRRDEYHGILSLAELRAIVTIIFPETAMKTAFLAEMDAEIN